jgi:YD repeat-containing protein
MKMDRTIKLPLALIALAVLADNALAQSRSSTSGNTTRFYDASGRSLGTATTNGNTTTNYDASGRVISRETRTGNTTTIYDPAGRNVGRFTTGR